MSDSAMVALARLPEALQLEFVAQQPDWALVEMARAEWWWVGRPEQQCPPGNWFVWLLLSGRGFGKTRTSAEWLADRVITFPVDTSGFRTEWLLIAETLPDAMRQCIRGPAGIGRVLERRLGPEKRSIHDGDGKWRVHKAPKTEIHFETGQVIYVEGADDEDVGRGYNAAGAWLDEFAKWPKPDGSWLGGIMPSLRADLPGDFPRAIVATTPKLVTQLIDWQDRGDTSVYLTTGSTYDNASNLAPAMLAELHRRLSGTRLGRQELHGELIREVEGSLWKYDQIEPFRVDRTPNFVQIIIGMDPAGSGTKDESGLVAAGRGTDGRDYVIGDWSKRVAGYEAAIRAWEMYRVFSANWLVVEDNVAKKWLRDTLVLAYQDLQKEGLFPSGGSAPIRTVTAKVNKRLRAEPVAARYEQKQGMVRHAGRFGDLETQMCSWVPDTGADSPDRVDAVVYALLKLDSRSMGRVADPRDAQIQRGLPTGAAPMGAGLPAGPYG